MALGFGIWQGLALAQDAGPKTTDALPDNAPAPVPDNAFVTAPFADEPGATEPAANEPIATEPVADEPAAAEPPSAAADAPTIDPLSVDAPMAADETDVIDLTRAVPSTLQGVSEAVTDVAAWVVATDDNGALPFVVIDKVAASILVFDADGRLLGAAPVLVGLAPGDDSAVGVGDRKLSAIKPDERTTPAGRFVAKFGAAAGDRTVLWVDYADAISLHPVVNTNAKEHRLERIRSSAPEDHRISYGCINVPAAFYQDVVLKAFAGGSGVVYILPDTKPLEEVFPGVRQSSLVQQDPSGIDALAQGPEPTLPPDPPSPADVASDIESGAAATPIPVSRGDDAATERDPRIR